MSRNDSRKADHGENFVPGSEMAPNLAPQPLDHFKRGYQERANMREREMEELDMDTERRQYTVDAQGLVDTLCRPGCNITQVLDRARDKAQGSFSSGKALTAMLSNLARRRKVDVAMSVWQWMDNAGIEKNVYHYNSMISVCEKTKDHRLAMQLFDEMDRKKIRKNEVTFSSAISACEKSGQWRDALRLLNQMKSEDVPQTVIAYNAAISACEKGLVPHKALEIFDQMKQEGVAPTVVTYSALISAAEKGQQWKLALEVLEEMKAAGFGANVIAYSAAISALSKGQMWAKALELFRELESSGNTPSIVTYNATMTALEKGLQWERALDLFDEMKSKGLAVTVVSYGSAISACEKGQQFRQCLAYLDEMSEVGIKKNVIIFGAAMSCMEKCGRADIAFQLMDRMKIEGVAPNVHIFNSAISACARCNLWEKGFELFSQMEEAGVARDVVTYNAVLDAVGSKPSLARKIFKEGVERGFYARVSRLGTQWLELDLHFLSLGGGEIALRWWFDECLVPYLVNSTKLAAVQSIDIVTGYGKTRMRGTRHGDDGMRRRIRAMLHFMNIREIEQSNQGRIHIDKPALDAEVAKHGGKILFDEDGYNKFKSEQLAASAAPEASQVVRPRCLPLRVGEIRPRNNQGRNNDRNRGPPQDRNNDRNHGPPDGRFVDRGRSNDFDGRGAKRKFDGPNRDQRTDDLKRSAPPREFRSDRDRNVGSRHPSDGYEGGRDEGRRAPVRRNDRYDDPNGRHGQMPRGDDRNSYDQSRGRPKETQGNTRNDFSGPRDDRGSHFGGNGDRNADSPQDRWAQTSQRGYQRGSSSDHAAGHRSRDFDQAENRGDNHKRSFQDYKGSNSRRGYDVGPAQDYKRQAR